MADQFPQPRRLLYSRQQTRDLLGGISLTGLLRMERAKLLTVRRLTGPLGAVYYPAHQVHALAEGDAEVPKPHKRRPIAEEEQEGADA
jgi:hypothetical protein